MPQDTEDISRYIGGLITVMEALHEPWGIKDLASRHIYMNKAALTYTNTPAQFEFEGKLDAEFPAEWAELSEDFIEHDRRTEHSQKSVAVIETHYWNGDPFLSPFVSEKIPIFDVKKRCIGTMWNAKPLTTLSPLVYIDKKAPSTLITRVENSLFTPSELEMIFLILQGFSGKEIARKTNLAYKTIENRIYNIYQKADVHSLHQFKAFCYHTGLDKYIPPRLLVKGIQYI